MANVVIVGSGPAGVSAALYTARAGLDTTVLTKGPGALARAEAIENYYGFEAPVPGAELERRGIAGAKAVGVSYCATCDAFFYKGKDVAVLGSGEYALHEASALLPLAKSVTLLTGGAELTAQFPPEVAVRTEKVEAVLGEQRVTGVRLAGGGELALDGVFVALGVAGSTALARKMGAEVSGNRIVVDEVMMTSIPGLFAAGDCTGGLLQVAKAVYEGAVAGNEVARGLRKGGFYGA